MCALLCSSSMFCLAAVCLWYACFGAFSVTKLALRLAKYSGTESVARQSDKTGSTVIEFWKMFLSKDKIN